MTFYQRMRSAAFEDSRSALFAFIITTAAILLAIFPQSASAATFTVGQRVRCDIYYKNPGTVIPTNPGETFNGHAANSGYFYRLHIDGLDPEGQLCKAEDMKLAGPAPAPVAAASQPATPAAMAPGKKAPAAQPVAGGPGRFGTTRTPHMTCPPVRSKPNIEQIKMLVECDDEHTSNNNLMYLDVNLQVQVGATRRYTQFSDGYATTIDTNAPVLPIRGTLDSYQCAPLSRYTNKGTTYDTDNTGKNCAVSPVRQAQGTCYRTTFGDWLCHLAESTSSATDRLNQPPPP